MERYKTGELTDQDAKEDLENRIILRRKRKFGTVRFIGELVIKNLLNWKISFKVGWDLQLGSWWTSEGALWIQLSGAGLCFSYLDRVLFE